MDQDLLISFEEIEDIHWWFLARRAIVLDVLLRNLGRDPDTVLEVGCGTGGVLTDLARTFPDAHVRGVDPSAGARAAAQRRGCMVAEGVFGALPADDESVDLVLALDVLEHCEVEAEAVCEAYRVLRPGGHLLLTVPALPSLWSSHDDINGHFRRYTRTSLGDALALAPFEPRRVTFFNTLLLPMGAAARVVGRIARAGGAIGVGVPAVPINRALLAIFRSERVILRHGDLPVGMSLLALVQKPTGTSV